MTVGGAVICLQISHDDFSTSAICLGPQIAAVLEYLAAIEELRECAWYACALDTIGPSDIREALQTHEPRKAVCVDDLPSFLTLVGSIGQFLDGVFFAVPLGEEPLIPNGLSADGPIERLVTNAIVQVCAFDTTFIEIGTDTPGIIARLQGRFGGKVAEPTGPKALDIS